MSDHQGNTILPVRTDEAGNTITPVRLPLTTTASAGANERVPREEEVEAFKAFFKAYFDSEPHNVDWDEEQWGGRVLVDAVFDLNDFARAAIKALDECRAAEAPAHKEDF